MTKSVLITKEGDLWKAHTEEETIKEGCTLKSAAVNAALAFVAEQPEGAYYQVKSQAVNGSYRVIWCYATDEFPPLSLPRLSARGRKNS